MKKIKKGFIFAAAASVVLFAAGCDTVVNVVNENEAEMPDLKDLAKENNGKTWQELEATNTMFDTKPNLSNLYNDYPDVWELSYQEYSAVWCYPITSESGADLTDGYYHSKYTPVMVRDGDGKWTFVKPEDTISRGKSYKYWSSDLSGVTYLSRFYFEANYCFDDIYSKNNYNVYISDSADYSDAEAVTESNWWYTQFYVKPRESRNLLIKVNFSENVETKKLFYSDSLTGSTVNVEATTIESLGGDYYVIPVTGSVNTTLYVRGYDLTSELQDFVTKYNGKSWYSTVESSFNYYNIYLNNLYWQDQTKYADFKGQEFNAVYFNETGKTDNYGYYDLNNATYTPVIYEGANGKWYYVNSDDLIDSSKHYELWDGEKEVTLLSSFGINYNACYKNIDFFVCQNKDVTNPDYDVWKWRDSDAGYYLAVKISLIDNLDSFEVYTTDENGNKVKYSEENGYYFIPLNTSGRVYAYIMGYTNETDLNKIKEEFDGMTWDNFGTISKYYSANSSLSYILQEFPWMITHYNLNNDYGVGYNADGNLEGNWCYDSSMTPILYKNSDGDWEFIQTYTTDGYIYSYDTIDKDKEYAYLPDVVEELFDDSTISLSVDNQSYEITIYYVDFNIDTQSYDWDHAKERNGYHVEPKENRFIAIDIKNDDEYVQVYIVDEKENEINYVDGHYLIPYDKDFSFTDLFYCKERDLDHKTVDLSKLLELIAANDASSWADVIYTNVNYDAIPCLSSIIQDYPDFDYLGSEEYDYSVLWYREDGTTTSGEYQTGYVPVVKMTGEDTFDYVKPEDTVDKDAEYTYWTPELETRNHEYQQSHK